MENTEKKKGKVKNPLHKRIPRELSGDWKKYLVVSRMRLCSPPLNPAGRLM